MAKLLDLQLCLAVCFFSTVCFAQTELTGKVTDGGNGEEMIGATIKISHNNIPVGGHATDFNGNYVVKLDPGIYDLKVSYIGFPDHEISGVLIKAGQANQLNIELYSACMSGYIFSTCYNIPLIDKDQTTSGLIISSENIRQISSKNIKEIAVMSAGVAW